MDIKCEDVWREISNYVDDPTESPMHLAMTKHITECGQCKSVLDGVQNVVALYGNERLFAPSADFERRLHSWLTERVEGPKGTWRGWAAAIGLTWALAAAVTLVALRDRDIKPPLRAEMSRPAQRIPQQLVAVTESGKLFHDPSCDLIHGKIRMVTPEEAVREGYTPCTRCLGEDLRSADSAIHGVELGGDKSEVATGAEEAPPKASR